MLTAPGAARPHYRSAAPLPRCAALALMPGINALISWGFGWLFRRRPAFEQQYLLLLCAGKMKNN